MNTVYLGLGGNVGERNLMLKSALRQIENKVGNIISESGIYETEAWGNTDQPSFLNLVIKLETKLDPEDVLKSILKIEEVMGRSRGNLKWQERVIDIDILFFNNEIINRENLHVPHPALHKRKFVLIPLAEIAPELMHPVLNKNIRELLSICEDSLEVKKVGAGEI